MTISDDWLRYPITFDEVEEELAELGAPDLWLRAWRAMLDRLDSGDELWVYGVTEYAESALEPADEIPGFDRVRDSEIPGRTEEMVGRTYEFREGFALVREGEVLDWLENPF